MQAACGPRLSGSNIDSRIWCLIRWMDRFAINLFTVSINFSWPSCLVPFHEAVKALEVCNFEQSAAMPRKRARNRWSPNVCQCRIRLTLLVSMLAGGTRSFLCWYRPHRSSAATSSPISRQLRQSSTGLYVYAWWRGNWSFLNPVACFPPRFRPLLVHAALELTPPACTL